MADDDEDPGAIGRYEWERIVRRVKMNPSEKLVALTIATYGSQDGTSIYPGVAKLAAVTGLSGKSVRAALAKLRSLGVIRRTREGSHEGRRGLADEYELRRPFGIEKRVHMLSVKESPESISCGQACVHPRSEELTSPDKPPRKPRRKPEQGNSVPRTGEVSSRTGEVSSQIRGSEFPPPAHDHANGTTQDQSDDHFRDVSTEGDDPADDHPEIDHGGAGCATCERRGDFAPCCEVHSLPLCPRCLRSIHAQTALAGKAAS